MKTSKLTGAALDWAVHYVEGLTGVFAPVNYCKWEHGGPIIERENISITGTGFAWWECDSGWYAHIGDRYSYGTTPLIAAMRCYVASKLGDEVEIPKEFDK